MEKYSLPFVDHSRYWSIDCFHVRSLFRAFIIYYTFCRNSDFVKLRDSDFEDRHNYILITFRSSKTDQYFQGTNNVLPEKPDISVCPVFLTRVYFNKFGFKFANEGNVRPKFISCQFPRKGRLFPLFDKPLHNNTATRHMRRLLAENNVPLAEKYTEKSLKASGVTALCEANEPLENVMIQGRWRSLLTPMHYRNTSSEFRLEIANRILVSSFPKFREIVNIPNTYQEWKDSTIRPTFSIPPDSSKCKNPVKRVKKSPIKETIQKGKSALVPATPSLVSTSSPSTSLSKFKFQRKTS